MIRSLFHLVMIKPSHYDDDGYVIQWMRSAMPCNTLATLYGLAEECAARQVLGHRACRRCRGPGPKAGPNQSPRRIGETDTPGSGFPLDCNSSDCNYPERG